MEISNAIVAKDVDIIMEHYNKHIKLFGTKPMPVYKQIIETIDSLKVTKYHIKYPDLKYKYSWREYDTLKTIYIFSVTNFPYDKSEIEKIFKGISQISLCGINKSSPEWENVKTNKDVCLYVGSTNHFQYRLKEHLFLFHPSANAMHLEKWFPNDLTITINIWNFRHFFNGEDSDYLQNIIDSLWDHYKPMFGRKGKITGRYF
ncbi:hypothetical protein AGMMS50293_21610 [Spirochaetia bacterium]|nr:hypothetical protein AGMMS50293_21610 [Spirochaetia bacterium]